ncbi:hypothetical protein F4810DRAFT_706805 [Camillea tinctor]|nr:hypothetical protein F4810DRAFT_706805 [Camillea tinctor]
MKKAFGLRWSDVLLPALSRGLWSSPLEFRIPNIVKHVSAFDQLSTHFSIRTHSFATDGARVEGAQSSDVYRYAGT